MDRSCRVAASVCENRTDLAGQLHARVRPGFFPATARHYRLGEYPVMTHLIGFFHIDRDMRHCTLLGRCSTQSGARISRATISFFRLDTAAVRVVTADEFRARAYGARNDRLLPHRYCGLSGCSG